MKYLLLLLILPLINHGQSFSSAEAARFTSQASNVSIIRDQWGIPHIYGKTDADAVFGLMYAQCEDNFSRVERNYIEMMGRLSEVEGKSQLYNDLEMRLIYDSAAAVKDFQTSPAWFKKLLTAFADGVNFYLFKHPQVHPLLLNHFEPWYPLLYTDGSIAPTQEGGLKTQDIKTLYNVQDDATSYQTRHQLRTVELDPSGSNGFALAPSRTASGNAMLYINPHVTFYFREEAQMVSEEGLNAYGAATWGQFFIYQGFNQNCGWMHTSSYADVADLYVEKIRKEGAGFQYHFDGKDLPVREKKILLYYKNGNSLGQTEIKTFATHHGPVMGMRDGQWLSLKENNRSLAALEQSWLRTKAKGFEDFKKIMDMRSNNSNNTVFADDKGNIAYWHGNFMPRRNPEFNWSLPVDGSVKATEWKGIHNLEEIVHVYNPSTGFIENCNSTPFTVSGAASPHAANFPVYMAPDGQNPRAINAIRLLSKAKGMTIDKLIAEVGYNRYLSAFEILLPTLFKAYDALQSKDSLKINLAEAMIMVKNWNQYADAQSIASALAIEWAYRLAQSIPAPKTSEAGSDVMGQLQRMSELPPTQLLTLFQQTMVDLTHRFGTWKTPWGEINRYQRTADSGSDFKDAAPSLPVSQAAATWGSIPSFATRRFPGTNRRYGLSGNSFVCAVEFGKKVQAKSIVTGGESFDPSSSHFNDQAKGYLEGQFKQVLFYKEDVLKHKEREYHPGE